MPSEVESVPGPARRPGPRALWWVTGVAAAATLVVGGYFVHFERAAWAFDSAPTCSAAAPAGSSCLQPRPATVERTGTSGSGDHTSYWIDLGGLGPSPVRVEMTGDGEGVWAVAEDGDKVTATLWRGAVVEVEDDTVVSATSAGPEVLAAEWLGGASAAFFLTVVLLWSALAVQLRVSRRLFGLQVAVGSIVLAGGMIIFPLALTFAERIEWWLLPASFGGAALFVLPGWLIVALRRRRKRAAALEGLL